MVAADEGEACGRRQVMSKKKGRVGCDVGRKWMLEAEQADTA